MFLISIISLSILPEQTTIHPGHNNPGYNDIFFIAIQSYGIDYACTYPQ